VHYSRRATFSVLPCVDNDAIGHDRSLGLAVRVDRDRPARQETRDEEPTKKKTTRRKKKTNVQWMRTTDSCEKRATLYRQERGSIAEAQKLLLDESAFPLDEE
jgi:hypothetical protein